ncbi:MAG TPA: hypothetical protein VJ574_04110 [Candidatus Bathyarchaeia archaeon]|nr:hypothetical protein [Candidatus Bathyarchaeia archaeon]
MRLTIVLLFAVLGFLAGVIAFLSYTVAVPWLQAVLPGIVWAPWFISGLAGALLTLVILIVWATLQDRKG